jgi:hypothetical protein
MGIKANFNSGDIEKIHNEFLDRITDSIEYVLRTVALELVKKAKNKSKDVRDFTDRTHNLRSSIGYVLYKNGKRISSYFEGKNQEGVQKGENYASEIAWNYNDGYVIVLVAGMHYAAYVEAKGFDVISGATLQADDEVQSAFNIAAQEISNVTGLDFNLVNS